MDTSGRIQQSQLGPQWRERKCPIFETVAKGDSNPGSLDCESGILPLSYRAPLTYDLGPGFNCYPLTKFRTNITNTIPSEAVTSQHRVLVAEMRVKKSKQRKSLGRKLINEACVRGAFCRKIVAKLSELLR